MCLKRLIALMMVLLLTGVAAAEGLEPLPMDSFATGPAPKKENYLSDDEYADESISVKIYNGRYADTDYWYAHVKIVHPSQLRTAPAALYYDGIHADFNRKGTTNGRFVARAANAVISLNGDFHTQSDCTVVLRMGKQYRNSEDNVRDLLIIDKNGDFSYLNTPTKKEYTEFYKANRDNLYQVFCFGPALVENGRSIITEEYSNSRIGSQKNTQRAAICQLGPLEYALVVCYSDQVKNNKGMTIFEFAQVCEQVGLELKPEGGCRLAFNLDGGNSATMNFQRLDKASGKWRYIKVNCPEIERQLSDIVYFATLVK